MSGSSQRHPGILRARLEFPVWYRTFAKSYVAWANAPGDLKTPLLLQGQSLAQAEGWLLACPDRLSESQKRFVVRSIAQRAKELGGQQPARDTTVKSQQKQKASSKWRRATDRNLLNLFGVIVIGMWFFLPDFMRDGLENALNTPDAYTDQRRSKVASAPPPSLSSDTENLDGAEDAISSAPVDGTAQMAPSDDADEAPAAATPPPPPPVPRAARLADLAREKLEADQHRVGLLLAIEAAEEALRHGAVAEKPTSERPAAEKPDDEKQAAEKAAVKAANDKATITATGLLARAMTTTEKLGQLAARSATARTVMFCEEARAIVAIAGDETLSVWPAGTSRRLASSSLPAPTLEGAGVDRDCRRLLLPNQDFNIEVHAIGGRKLATELNGHEAPILAAAFSPDGSAIVTASRDSTARIWDARTGRQRFVLSGHDWHVVAAEFSRDGRRVLTASSDMTARIWDAVTGKQLKVFNGHQGVVGSARFAAAGTRVLTTSLDGSARIWDAATGEPIHTLKQPGGLVDAEMNTDGDRIATTDSNGGVQLWDAASGQLQNVIPGGGSGIRTVRFAPDGRSIVVLGWDGKLAIYDTATAAQTLILSGTKIQARAVEFGAGGRTLVGLDDDGARHTWPLLATPAEAIAQAKAIAPACLTADERLTLGIDGEAPIWCGSQRPRDAALP